MIIPKEALALKGLEDKIRNSAANPVSIENVLATNNKIVKNGFISLLYFPGRENAVSGKPNTSVTFYNSSFRFKTNPEILIQGVFIPGAYFAKAIIAASATDTQVGLRFTYLDENIQHLLDIKTLSGIYRGMKDFERKKDYNPLYSPPKREWKEAAERAMMLSLDVLNFYPYGKGYSITG